MSTSVGSHLHPAPQGGEILGAQSNPYRPTDYEAHRAVQPHPSPATPPLARSRPLRVLLVEDSLLIRKHLVSLLEDSEGIVVCGEVDTEADALTALRVGRFDAVVVNLQLREGSGFGVLQHLKLNHPDLLAIVLTNSNTAAMRARSLALGAHHFLDKSSEFERVAELLEGLR
ncbi:response regulator [Methyloversatilis sp.]|uniref:response regulator n=1 Tax=Methyloversatilis sp. TaxID=2569862 RepID=UPI003D276F2B